MIKKRSERVSEIVKSFTKFGFGFLINKKFKDDNQKNNPTKLRLMFEELGTSFVKLGQILSTRTNILPEEYIKELSKLQDETPSFSFDIAKEILKSELGKNLDEIFLTVNPVPIASASVSQVHEATLINGDNVIVKIQRPKIKDSLLQDIDILTDIFRKAPKKYMDILLDPIDALKEIKSTTLEELDFKNEAKAMLRFKEENAEIRCIGLPKIYINYSSSKVLVQEKILGIKIDNKSKLEKNGYLPKDIGKKLILSYLYQVFNNGFFHGDPHPGNLLISDKKIYFIDFGIMGSLSKQNQKYLNELLKALIIKDIDKLVDLILEVGISFGDVNRNSLYYDVENLFNSYIHSSIADIKISDLFSDILKAANKNKLKMPKDFTSLLKSLLILEGVVINLAPELSIMDIAKDYFKENTKAFSLKDIDLDYLALSGYSLLKTSLSIPIKFDEVLKNILAGRAKLNLEIVDFNEKWLDFNKMVNRVVFALVVGAMIIASALVILSGKGPTINGISMLGIGGFLISGVFSLWLLISIIKSGNL